jgi:hypothetical protein
MLGHGYFLLQSFGIIINWQSRETQTELSENVARREERFWHSREGGNAVDLKRTKEEGLDWICMNQNGIRRTLLFLLH